VLLPHTTTYFTTTLSLDAACDDTSIGQEALALPGSGTAVANAGAGTGAHAAGAELVPRNFYGQPAAGAEAGLQEYK
jgi:hypothetical protein